MVPDIPLRLQTMLRSMTDWVIPSLPADNALAKEQAYLVLGHLKLIADQIDHHFQFQLAEIEDLIELNDRLGAKAKGGQSVEASLEGSRDAVARAQPLADLSLPSGTEIASIVHALRTGADDLVKAAAEDGSADFRDAIGSLVMAHAERQLERDRIMARSTGFDLKAEKLPGADAVLAARK